MKYYEPEINLAKRVVSKYKLNPPIDLYALVKRYATVEELVLPIDADGISINIKVSGKHPHVIINQSISHKRKRFTLAHELGHVIIPWHHGTIIDVTNIKHEHNAYSRMEAEANRFAAELLMPSDWLKNLISKCSNPEIMVRTITDEADVSSLAATIKLINGLPAGYIYANVAEDGQVLSSGRSEGTIANAPIWEEFIEPDALFPFCKKRFDFVLDGSHYFWWDLDSDIEIPKSHDDRSWQEVMNEIVADIDLSGMEPNKYIQSLAGCIGYANSSVRGADRTVQSIYSACLQRLHSKPGFTQFIEHPAFEEFLIKKANALLLGKQS